MLNIEVPKFKFFLTDQVLYNADISLVGPQYVRPFCSIFTKSLDFTDLLTITWIIISARMEKIDIKRLQEVAKRKGVDATQEVKRKKIEASSLLMFSLLMSSSSTPGSRSGRSLAPIKCLTCLSDDQSD